jgi:hypothetical protein
MHTQRVTNIGFESLVRLGLTMQFRRSVERYPEAPPTVGGGSRADLPPAGPRIVQAAATIPQDLPVKKGGNTISKFVRTLQELGEVIRGILDRRTAWFLMVLLLFWFLVSAKLASLKFLWFDEFFTYYIVGLPSAKAMWSAMGSGISPMPPTFYWLTRFSQHWLGPSDFAIRSPELAGFLLASLCLFHFIRRRTNALYGLIGMLALWITGAYPYAYEARPYALVLGFCGLALVCWQAATDGLHRKPALVGLFLACAAAVFSHYGAVIILFPLGLGELVRSILRKKMDWPVWLSFCGAALPLLIFLPLLHRSISPYGSAMWSHPQWNSILECYTILLAGIEHPLAAVLCVLTIWRVFRVPSVSHHDPGTIPLYEIASAIGLMLLPVVGLLQAVLVTGQLAPRYVMPMVMGFGILLALLAHKNLQDDAVGGILLMALLLAGWLSHARWEYTDFTGEKNETRKFCTVAARQPGTPIVVASAGKFIKLAHYASPDISSRLDYLVDVDAARQYSGSDSVELDFLDLENLLRNRESGSLNLREAQPFLRTHNSFLLYVTPDNWLFPMLYQTGARMELVDMTDEGTLYRVQLR